MCSLKVIQFILIAKICLAELPNTTQVTVYTSVAWGGNQQDIDILQCTNFSSHVAKHVSSLKGNNNCVRLYEEVDCEGKFIEIFPYSPFQGNLFQWKFAEKAASAGPCGDPCDVTLTGPVPPKSGINVSVYEMPFYRGAMAKLNLKGCTKVPRKMSKSIGSINVTSIEENCFELFNDPECKPGGERLGGGIRESIELRPGSPSLDDLNYWRERIQVVSAISHCSHKCNINKETEVLPSSMEPTKENPVVIYDETDFTGNMLPISFSGFNHCVPLDQFDHWEGNVMSAKIYGEEATCVIFYDELDCTGDWELALFRSEAEIGTRKFCKRVLPDNIIICPVARSLLFCDPKKTKF